jgi:hypothetical protein
MKAHLALAALLALGSDDITAQGVRTKSYYEGLPDLDAQPAFGSMRSEQSRALRDFLVREPGSVTACTKGSELVGVREICGRGAEEGRLLLRSLAHGLPPGRFASLWRANLRVEGEADLLVQFDTQKDEVSDRYAAFFAFRWAEGAFQVTAASWFLEGSLRGVHPFGPTPNRKVFLEVLSCTACHPWVYLVVCDFLVPPSGASFEFQYNLDEPEAWQAEVEYKLPGMGHSIDATVETRLPVAPQPAGPHLMQHFDVQDGEDEWWTFTCKGQRCGAQMFKGRAPAEFLARWKGAKPL